MDSFSQMTQEQKQVRQQLSKLQNWESKKFAPDRLREHHMNKAVKYETVYNEIIVKKLRENAPAAEASQSASGIKLKPEKAAKETYKQKKENQKKTKEAKKINPYADHVSYDIKEGFQYYDKHYNNSLSAMPADVQEQCQRNQIDKEILKTFSRGHCVTRKGEPEDESDERTKQFDLTFYADYSSGELDRRIPHLRRMVNEILDTNLSLDLFAAPMLKRFAGMTKNQIDRMKTFVKVMQDPINAPFFEQLSQKEKGLLFVQIKYSDIYEKTFEQVLGTHAIDYKSGTYLYYNSWINTNKEPKNFSADLSELKEQADEMVREKYDIIKEESIQKLMAGAEERNKEYNANDERRAYLGFTSYYNEFCMNGLADCRHMIEQHPEEYNKNKKLINKIYEDAYRTADLIGDYALKSLSSTTAVNHFSDRRHLNYEENRFLEYSEADNDLAKDKLALLHRRLVACTHSLKHFLEGKRLLPEAALYLDNLKVKY